MVARMHLNENKAALDKSMEALSSGLRINRAADDASGMAIANTLRQQAEGLGQSIKNANDAIGVTQTADGALEEYTRIIDTVRIKAIQAASDSQNLDTRQKIQEDIDRLLEEAQNIASTTSFNGQTLLNGAFKNKSFHIGAYAGETVKLSIDNTQTDNVGEFAFYEGAAYEATTASQAADTIYFGVRMDDLGGAVITTPTITLSQGEHSSLEIAQTLVDAFNEKAQSEGEDVKASVYETSTDGKYGIRVYSNREIDYVDFQQGSQGGTFDDNLDNLPTLNNNLSTVDVTTRENAEKAIIITDYALKDVDATRADIGSVQNQLESTIRNISVTQVNVKAAESQIRDIDFAKESANFAKLNILVQSGSYALSQANAIQENVIRVLSSSIPS